MRSTYSSLLQSKFFTPAFNSAIFDGPVRIYFSQIHEPLALKIYFALQHQLPDLMSMAKKSVAGRNVLVLLYPTKESFQISFENQDTFIVHEELDCDSLIGVNGPFEDYQLSEVLSAIQDSISKWEIVKPVLQASII